MLSEIIDTIIKQGVPDYTVRILLYLPVVATIVAFARYFVGWKSLGIYAPLLLTFALYDLSQKDSGTDLVDGLKYGITLIGVSIFIALFMHVVLRRTMLHYLAKVSIIISLVSLVIPGLLYLGASFGNFAGFTNANAMPILVIVLVVDIFIKEAIKIGGKKALNVMISTILLSILMYLVISTDFSENLIFDYPEISIIVLLLDFLIGRWEGLRLTEYFRFSDLLKEEESKKDDTDTKN